jgi:hypothetical protein
MTAGAGFGRWDLGLRLKARIGDLRFPIPDSSGRNEDEPTNQWADDPMLQWKIEIRKSKFDIRKSPIANHQ